MLFTSDYYERGLEKGLSCYSNYRWIPELTIPMCSDIISYLGIRKDESILDLGCAKGFLVYGMRLLHRNAFGVDISPYAIMAAPSEVKEFLKVIKPDEPIPLLSNGKYDWVIAKDVLEHIDYTTLPSLLRSIADVTDNMFAIVPLGKNGKYEIPAYEFDVTHRIREPLEWWKKTFNEAGFDVTESSYLVPHIKSNWASWEKGNGFFQLKHRG